MCRLLGYLGPPVQLDRLLYKPEHSLVVQSYQPLEMTAGLLNADGFGLGWYHAHRTTEPFTYKNTLPIWNDTNLPQLSRFVESGCVLANVRSATPGLSVDLSNCQPFGHDRILGVHNGFIENFRLTLYRSMRDRLSDAAYEAIQGLTDSEHIFALLRDALRSTPAPSLAEALQSTLVLLLEMAQAKCVGVSANLILSDGDHLVASRFASRYEPCSTRDQSLPVAPAPTLYWLRDDPLFPQAVLIASEPMFPGDWVAFPERSILTTSRNLDVQILPF